MAVFITGASSGIGEACAQAFAEAGYDLVLVARREDKLKTMADILRSRFKKISVDTFRLDVRESHGIDELIQKHPEVFQKIDILINNAGLVKGLVPIQQGTVQDWDTMIDTNIKGLLYTTRAILPGFLERKKGHIINIGSTAGSWVYPKGNVYCATKFAVRALTEAFRMDLHGTGIRVTEISPGMVETEFSEVRFGNKEQAKALYEGKTPLKASDVAETILWCAQRPVHVNIQELIIFPASQSSVTSGMYT
jgi:3-hydroxy acid dehydrogenase/malonic semialdehyde reductase